MKKLIISMLSLIIFIGGCEKTYYLDIPSELKDWGYFKEGSYWIYKESNTNKIDSIYVVSVSSYTDKVVSDKKYTNFIQRSRINLTNKNKKYLGLICLDSHSLSMEENDSIKQYKSKYSLIDLNSTNIPTDHTPYHLFVEQLETFALNGNNYSNVIHIKSLVYNTYYNMASIVEESTNEYWLSKHNWLIKKTTSSKFGNEEWILIRNKISQ